MNRFEQVKYAITQARQQGFANDLVAQAREDAELERKFRARCAWLESRRLEILDSDVQELGEQGVPITPPVLIHQLGLGKFVAMDAVVRATQVKS